MCLSQAVEVSQIESLVQNQSASPAHVLWSSEEWEQGVVGVIWDCVIPWPGASNAGWNHPQLLQQPLCQPALAPPAPT